MLRSRVQTTGEQYRKVLLDQGLEVDHFSSVWMTWRSFLLQLGRHGPVIWANISLFAYKMTVKLNYLEGLGVKGEV